jgi:hypothetical protein
LDSCPQRFSLPEAVIGLIAKTTVEILKLRADDELRLPPFRE